MYKSILVPIDLGDKEKSKLMVELARELTDGKAEIRLLTASSRIFPFLQPPSCQAE